MNLVQLSNYVRVCEVQSFSKAASMVGIAQPALSRQIRALEVAVGSPLLQRHAWGVSTTAAGDVLLVQARAILKSVDAAKDAVRAIDSEPIGVVALGAPASIAMALFPQLLDGLRSRYPKLRPQLIEAMSGSLHTRILQGELDLAILHGGPSLGPISQTPLLDEPIGLVASPALMAGAKVSNGAELKALPMILTTGTNRSRLTLEQIPGAKPLNILAEVDCMPAMLQMITRGQGFTLLPYSAVHSHVANGELAFSVLPIPQLHRELVLVRPAERVPTRATAAVEGAIRELVALLAPQLRWRANSLP